MATARASFIDVDAEGARCLTAGRIRHKLSQVAESARAVKRLSDTGIIDLGNLRVTLETAKNARVYGPQATLAIQGARKYPSLPALVDERGTLTYQQVDDMSSPWRGVEPTRHRPGSVVVSSAATTEASFLRWPHAESSVPGWC